MRKLRHRLVLCPDPLFQVPPKLVRCDPTVLLKRRGLAEERSDGVKSMDDPCEERLRYYGVKCVEHLNRVRLSHMLAVSAISTAASPLEPIVEHLLRDSFDESTPPHLHASKLLRGLHEIHLVSLKANFELYLNRSLTAVWLSHLTSLVGRVPSESSASLREIAAAIAGEDEPQSAAALEFIVDRIVPVHALGLLVSALQNATDINAPKVLNQHDFQLWPQLLVAFEVRHLLEHRDGKVDKKFQAKVGGLWSNSSWKDRHLETMTKVTLEAKDVEITHEAMVQASRLLTAELCSWSLRSRQR